MIMKYSTLPTQYTATIVVREKTKIRNNRPDAFKTRFKMLNFFAGVQMVIVFLPLLHLYAIEQCLPIELMDWHLSSHTAGKSGRTVLLPHRFTDNSEPHFIYSSVHIPLLRIIRFLNDKLPLLEASKSYCDWLHHLLSLLPLNNTCRLFSAVSY